MLFSIPAVIRRASALGLCFLVAAAARSSAQDAADNAYRVGFVDLSTSGSSTQGLWSYEADGRFYCLQTRGGAGLAVIDTTDTSNPVSVANVPGSFRKVQVYQNYAYATTDSGPTAIIDLSTPSQATRVASMSIGAHTLRIDGSRLYLNRSGGMFIYDLSDPESPQLLGTWSGSAHDCRPVGDIVYVNGFQANPTRILNVADPTNIVQLGTLPNGNHASDLYVAPTGQLVLLTCDEQRGGHVKLFDVTTPAAPELLSSYQASPNTSVHNVEVKGAYAYVAYYQDQLRVLDLTDLSDPVEAGTWDNNFNNTGSLFSDAWEAIPDHDAVYMNQMTNTAAGPRGLHVIDFFPGFGTGSDGTGGVIPRTLWSFGPASPGNDRFALRLTRAAPDANAWLLIGRSNQMWAGQSLPMTMESIGAPNATLYVSPDMNIAVTTDGQGNATVSIPVPANYPYTTFYVQWVVRDRGAPNSGGFAFSQAGKIVVW